MICALTLISVLAVCVIGGIVFKANRPQNFIAPVAPDSLEMETAKLFAGPEGAHIYKFTTTDEYDSLVIFCREYRSGEPGYTDDLELGFSDIGSPENGEILIFPDFNNFVIKVIISAGGCKYSTELPILDNVPDREYYGRSSTRIEGETQILYGTEQPLLGLIYDNDEMSVPDIYDILSGETDALSKNDFVYLFSFKFSKDHAV